MLVQDLISAETVIIARTRPFARLLQISYDCDYSYCPGMHANAGIIFKLGTFHSFFPRDFVGIGPYMGTVMIITNIIITSALLVKAH